jgi:sugar lactone lactonase YvrE
MRFTRTGVLAAATLCTLAAPVHADDSWQVLAQFDDRPEGLVPDGQGGLFTSLFASGRVLRIAGDGTATVIASITEATGGAAGSTIGIDFDGKDTIYVAFAGHSDLYPWPNDPSVADLACSDSTVTATGLYAVTVSTGAVAPVATRADGYGFCYADDPLVLPDGAVLVSDLSRAVIWRIEPATGAAAIWSADPLFDPGARPLSGFAVGPNGIALGADGASVYAVTGGNPMLVRIPLNADGSAGAGAMVTYGYDNLDGLEVGPDGAFYLAEAFRSEVWRVAPDASSREQLGNPATAPLGGPASMAFLGDSLCVTNLDFFGLLPADKANTIVCKAGVVGQ